MAASYRERASLYLKNFEEERFKGNREKAGEALWGVISCLVNALSILSSGKPSGDHYKQSEFAHQFLESTFADGKELSRIYKTAEKFHANFYHAFLDEEEFDEKSRQILSLAERLDKLVMEKIRGVV